MQKKILIVDDDQDLLVMLEEMLLGAGYEVIKALDGEEAIVAAKEYIPDLIILDVMMPKMDGGKAASIMKEDPITKNIPIVFLTCLVTRSEINGHNVIGDKYYIAKPYKESELLDIVNKLLKQ